MSTITTSLAALFFLVAAVRIPPAWRARELRASLLTVVFAWPGLLLLNMELVHWLIRAFPWAAGPIRVAPFLFATFALWALGEAAAYSAVGREFKRGSLLEPLLWSIAVVGVFIFVDLHPLAEVFTIIHSEQLAGLVYTLIYYTAAGWFAGRMAYRVFRQTRRTAGYLFLGYGGVLIAAACAFQYALLVPVYLRSPLPNVFYSLFDLAFYTGVLSVVIGLQVFVVTRFRRHAALKRMIASLEGILAKNDLPPLDVSIGADGHQDAYAIFAYLVTIDDYTVTDSVHLDDTDLKAIQTARSWVSKEISTLTLEEYVVVS
ncbi:hypothetical protein [Microbacterium sp. TPU 3598]|uniref:hypothetical protein n=1 Tax=Microbacterium sp. TPU 3598 TaxID=1938334 RepID=UPI000BBAD7B0|nr:hypothetical protein [Microbacterium sp. TPU 3598]